MKFITSLSVERENFGSSLLCGDVKRIVVVVFTRDGSDDGLFVYGVDPDHIVPENDKPVFGKMMPQAYLGTFLKRIIEGEPPIRTCLHCQGTLPPETDFSVDIPVPEPKPPGPKLQLVFAYAGALRIDELVAQVDAAESPTRSMGRSSQPPALWSRPMRFLSDLLRNPPWKAQS
jgi:hypothetical protein